jgi:hypothetical protein
VARIFDAAWRNPAGRTALLVSRTSLIFGILSLTAVLFGAAGRSRVDALAKPLRLSVAEAQQLGSFATPMLVVLATLGVIAALAWYRSHLRLGFVCLALFPVLLVHAGIRPIEVAFNAKSARQLAERIPKLPPQTELAFLSCFPNGLSFYLGRTGTLITADGNELTSNYILFNLKDGRPWPKNLVPLSEFDHWLASRKSPIYLIAQKSQQAKLDQLAAEKGAKVEPLDARHFGVLLPAPGGS